MAIYFPHGFNSGEPVRIFGGVTLIAGKLSKAKTDLLVVPITRGPLGGVSGPVAKQTRDVVSRAGRAVANAIGALEREPGALHLVPRGELASARLAVLELDEPPGTAVERMRIAAQVLDCGLVTGAREIAIGPFEDGVDGARATLDAFRKALADASDDAPRVLLIVPDPATFRAIASTTIASTTIASTK